MVLLNTTLEGQKAAIATLVNLQKMGMSEIEISRLVKLVNGWGKGNGNFANGLESDTHINCQLAHIKLVTIWNTRSGIVSLRHSNDNSDDKKLDDNRRWN